MKILNVSMSLDPVKGGGSVERTFQMSRFLVGAGIQCTLITTDMDLTQERIKDLEGVCVVALPTVLKRFYFPMLSYQKIVNIIRYIDIIHLMNHWTILNALVYIIARRLKKPYVVCPAGALPIYGRSRTIKTIYNVLIGHRIIRNANGYIAISPDEIGHFAKYSIDADKVTIIPNGVDPYDFLKVNGNVFREKFNIGDKPFVLFLGRLNHIKGPDLLLKAFCNLIKDQHFKHHLVFAGPDGGMLPELKQLVSDHGTGDKVHFIGYVGGIEKASAYYAADLLVIPSRQEAMSIVVLEAGITGTPVLLTDRCGFNAVEEIGGGKVVSATVDGLQGGLTELLSRPDQLKTMGKKLYDYVANNFTWKIIINKYLLLYKTILNNGS